MLLASTENLPLLLSFPVWQDGFKGSKDEGIFLKLVMAAAYFDTNIFDHIHDRYKLTEEQLFLLENAIMKGSGFDHLTNENSKRESTLTEVGKRFGRDIAILSVTIRRLKERAEGLEGLKERMERLGIKIQCQKVKA